VFDYLFGLDPSGRRWLDSLVSLAVRPEGIATLPKGQQLVAGHRQTWGASEVALPAPLALLEYLVCNLEESRVRQASTSGVAHDKRMSLARRDSATVNEALTQLRSGLRGSDWFVLEGPSKPDALLEMNDVVLCVEGKRTEPACTTHTTWMRRRSQLLRHMDAAMNAFPNKRVCGLLIVEGGGDASTLQPSAFWLSECAAQYAQPMLNESLPHRSPSERVQLADGVLGVTTWQAVCAAVGPDWRSLPDAI
jgi:hypothetical protein